MISFLPTLAEPGHFSIAEKVLFAGLVLASAFAFWRRFGVVLDKILKSKKDPSFHLFPIGKRVREFILEVVLQAKVIRERPAAGLAHAFVFWAFCAFMLVTLNHCASAFGLGFLSPAGTIGRFYFYFAAAFAAACAIGILALFVRRFLIRPKWLGEKLSWESGFIALLIFALMATYLAAFYTTDASSTTRLLWWVHSLALFVFLPIIPHTKHLHLLLSPFTVFLSRGSFSQIPPLNGDEDFGLIAGTDLTQLVSLQAYSCVECGRCTEHCPAANTGKILNPKEIILGVRSYLNDLGPASDQPLLGKYNSQQAAFECTTCGACEFQCPVGIEHVPILIGLRRGAVNTGTWEDDHGGKLFLALERGSNALGINPAERDKFIEKQQLPIFDGTQEYCLWLGCMGGYDPKGREIVADFARVMNFLGTSYGVLRKEKCTGDPVRRLGNDLLFQQLAEANLEALAQNKVKKIVTICPHCVRTIQEDWKEYGTPPEVEHHSEFLARFADKLPTQEAVALTSRSAVARASSPALDGDKLQLVQPTLSETGAPGLASETRDENDRVPSATGQDFNPEDRSHPERQGASGHDLIEKSHPEPQEASGHDLIEKSHQERQEVSGHDFSRAVNAPISTGALAPVPPQTIVFHDPCYLGRYRNVYDEPRTVAALAGELIEPERNRERSFCCGAGGGLTFLGEETGQRVSHVRAAELVATGAQTIATACPFCNSMFRDALATDDNAPQLLDIAQIAARNLPPPTR